VVITGFDGEAGAGHGAAVEHHEAALPPACGWARHPGWLEQLRGFRRLFHCQAAGHF
jgi:hypothetical protein